MFTGGNETSDAAPHGKFIHKYLHYAKKPEFGRFVTGRLFASRADFEMYGTLILGKERFSNTTPSEWASTSLRPLVDVLSQTQKDIVLTKFPKKPPSPTDNAASPKVDPTTRDNAIKAFHRQMAKWPEWRNFIKKMCRWIYDSIHANDREVTIVDTIPFVVTARSFKSQHVLTRKFRYCPVCKTMKLIAAKIDGTPWGYMCDTCRKKRSDGE